MNWLANALLSALFAGLVAIFGKIGMKDIDSTVATTARAFIMCLTLVIVLVCKRNFGALALIAPKAWLYVTLAGLAGAASWLFYFQALKLGDASKVAPIDRLSIIITLALAAIFLGEKLSTGVLIGSGLILAGALLVARG